MKTILLIITALIAIGNAYFADRYKTQSDLLRCELGEHDFYKVWPDSEGTKLYYSVDLPNSGGAYDALTLTELDTVLHGEELSNN